MIKFLITDIDGTLTDGKIHYTENGDRIISYSKIDGEGFNRLREERISAVWITTEEKDEAHRKRAKDLQIPYFFSTSDKLGTIVSFLVSKNVGWNEIAYIGDDVSDLSCLILAGKAYVPKDSVLDNMFSDPYEIFNVTNKKGGEGCVREVIELILASGDF